jgi:Ca-activated chloride channel family protein
MIILMWLASWLVPFQQEKEVFRFDVQVRTVYADVFVTRDGEPVTGLTADDFEVLDNGVPQKVHLLDHGEMPLSTMLLLDVSGSVAGEELDHLRAAAHAYLEELEPKDEVGLMTFTYEMRLRKGLSHNRDELHRILNETMEKGDTNLHDALYAGVKYVEAQAGRPLVVVFTDGLDRTSWLKQSEVLELLKASDAVVYAVGVPSRPISALKVGGRSLCKPAELTPSEFLRGITKQTGGRTWFLEPDSNLKSIFLSILKEMKNRYLLSYHPEGVALDGWHSLEVKLKGRKADEIRARPGYLAGPVYH